MFTTAAAATVLAAEESAGYELPIPHWLVAVIFFCFFLLMMIVTMSFSGRGIRRDGKENPAELSSEEETAMSEYTRKHRR